MNDNVSNHVFEALWEQAAQAVGPRVVKRGKTPEAGRAILFHTFGLRRAAITEHAGEPGYQIRLIDGKGANELIAADGTIVFPRPIHSQNLVRLLAAVDDWLEACETIYGLGTTPIRQAPSAIQSGAAESQNGHGAQGPSRRPPRQEAIPTTGPQVEPTSSNTTEEWPTGDGGINP